MTGYKYIKGGLYIEKGTYVVRARVPDPQTGKMKHRSKTTGIKVKGGSKRKAETIMREILAQWEQEANRTIYPSEPLFSEYVQKFLDQSAIDHRENTTTSYIRYAKTHILPALGQIKVREIKRQHIQSLYNSLYEKGLSPNSIRKYAVIVTGALHLAVLDEIIPYNIAKDGSIKVPKAKRYRSEVYDQAQAMELLKAAHEEPEPMRSAIILALCYGLRREEVCGLRWSDIDFLKTRCISATPLHKTAAESSGMRTQKQKKATVI